MRTTVYTDGSSLEAAGSASANGKKRRHGFAIWFDDGTTRVGAYMQGGSVDGRKPHTNNPEHVAGALAIGECAARGATLVVLVSDSLNLVEIINGVTGSDARRHWRQTLESLLGEVPQVEVIARHVRGHIGSPRETRWCDIAARAAAKGLT